MSETQFGSNLTIALAQLDKLNWSPVLVDIEKKFRDAIDNREDVSFASELLNMLWTLNEAKATDPDIPTETMFAIRFAKLDIWTLRFSKKTGNTTTFVNPLDSSLDDTEISQGSTAFPSEDIIKRWARDRLQ